MPTPVKPPERILERLPHDLTGIPRFLVQSGRLSVVEAQNLIAISLERKTRFATLAIEQGIISCRELAHLLSEALSLPLLDLNAMPPLRHLSTDAPGHNPGTSPT